MTQHQAPSTQPLPDFTNMSVPELITQLRDHDFKKQFTAWLEEQNVRTLH